MEIAAQLEMVLTLLERFGTEIRHVRLGGEGGGLCVVKGCRIVFVDLDADPATRLERCVRALAESSDLDDQFLPPAVRELIQRFSPSDGDE